MDSWVELKIKSRKSNLLDEHIKISITHIIRFSIFLMYAKDFITNNPCNFADIKGGYASVFFSI
ncbi:hypothetical protein AWE51_19175 [Aquimarina aggregata]|uniref:Uncharacterized protein n=1 Tax=Aquimarina aggregata TaxID=1642818 RepID=A0A162WKX7_9FLAO|nr:hypothetical protein AWE51_19175 [Aquimarina aggregata]